MPEPEIFDSGEHPEMDAAEVYGTLEGVDLFIRLSQEDVKALANDEDIDIELELQIDEGEPETCKVRLVAPGEI